MNMAKPLGASQRSGGSARPMPENAAIIAASYTTPRDTIATCRSLRQGSFIHGHRTIPARCCGRARTKSIVRLMRGDIRRR